MRLSRVLLTQAVIVVTLLTGGLFASQVSASEPAPAATSAAHVSYQHWRYLVWREVLYVNWRHAVLSRNTVTGVWWDHYGLWRLPPRARAQFSCVRSVESHNHTPDTSSANAQGLYQFMPTTWLPYGKRVFGGLPRTPNEATRAQQDAVASWYWLRNGRLAPEWYDGCGP
jgi:hypothetical protein